MGRKRGGKPKPPKLPEDTKDHKVPQELRDFVDCKGNTVTLGGGAIDWLDLPGGVKPTVTIVQGAAPGTFDITISIDIKITTIELKVKAEVKDGQLVVDTSQVPGNIPGLGNPKKSIDDWVKKLNDWFASNGKKLGDATLKDGKLTLTKVATVGMAEPPSTPGWGKKALVGTAVAIGIGTGVTVGVVALNDGGEPGANDTIDVAPTGEPTGEPTGQPTGEPTEEPTGEPTEEPTAEPTAEPTDAVLPPLASGELRGGLIRRDDLPSGFVRGQVNMDGLGQGPGPCNGEGEAQIAPVHGQAATVFQSSQSGTYVFEALFSYRTVEDAALVLETLRQDGMSCSTYDVTNGALTYTYTIRPAPVPLPDGWDASTAFRGTVALEGGQPNQWYGSFAQRDTVLVVVFVGGPAPGPVTELMRDSFDDAIFGVDGILTF